MKGCLQPEVLKEKTALIYFFFLQGVYAMINLYGQCVQISVYDRDYQGAPVIALSEQQQQQAATEPVSTTDGTDGTNTGM